MKLLDKLNLDEKEKMLIKRVFFTSLAVCFLTVVITWSLQLLFNKKSTQEIVQQDDQKTDFGAIFDGKKKNLLPIDVEAHKVAADRYMEDSNTEKSITHLLRVLTVEKKNRKIKLDLATAYLKAGHYEKAEALLAELIEEEGKDSLVVPIHCQYGLTLFYSRKIEESITWLDKVIKQNPTSAEAYCYRGQVEAALNMNSERIEQFFDKSLELNPNYIEAIYQLARYYMNKPNVSDSCFQKARRLLLRLIEIQPLNPKVHSRLGMVYYYLKQPSLSENAYKTALQLNDKDYNTHYNLGELYYSQFKQPEKAIREFKKTIQIKRDHVEANFKMGLISLENNMTKESIQFFKTALQREPHNIRVLLQLGVAYEKMNMVREAVATYKSILSFDALNEVALQKLKLLKYDT